MKKGRYEGLNPEQRKKAIAQEERRNQRKEREEPRKGFAERAEDLRKSQLDIEDQIKEEHAELSKKDKEKGVVLPEGKERDKYVQMWLEKKAPKIYGETVALRDKIKSLLENEELIHQKETYDAAKRVLSKLDVSIKKWEKDINDHLVIRKKSEGLVLKDHTYFADIGPLAKQHFTQEFYTSAVTVITENKASMMKDPGWWNQVKEAINNWLAEFDVGPIFKVEPTHFGIDQDIQKGMDNLENPDETMLRI
ncbi:hypothetical protein [Legionella bozemanae]|uniref:Uncharacterized protein n=1 Tax=Legionella bozemanae TaxID=447 RepID=A0A0W0RIY0_LEGBO|nr:hypothetical protein [Legionella bozemanae]KTC71034.1 hypothetical protein Lboz_2611 [Legionella bozemanae]STO34694.1 Uncharacterised protein [Legionella bozemanae]